ncbi:hypothetical protein FZ025_20520 [Xanthomonas hyacinthi]|uniref:hypothetical protein n=1 Tax=Xanthomonas hyacinthi TaxID=56455 RepID=UPI0011B02317|nr:hypothetical protein [Xanthomonas hyacinthi]QGY78885.1 hypothetical protein FZ025_20520 [Xanthomonas hyacinthi]
MLEVQLHKTAPRFVLNFGVVPDAGIDLPWGRFSKEEATVASLPEAVRMYRNASMKRWFGPGVFRGNMDHEIKLVKILYPQVERWFEVREKGRNLVDFSFVA